MLQIISIIISIVGIVVSATVAVLLFRLKAAQDRNNRAEDARNKQVSDATDELEGAIAKMHELAAKLVDERFRAMTHEINTHVNGFKLTLDSLTMQLRDGAETFESLAQRDQTIEMAVAGKFDQLKEFLFENMATKKDVLRHEETVDKRFDRIGQQVETLGKGLAIAEHVMRNGRGKAGGQ